MADWPPAKCNYTAVLKTVGFREVEPAKFKSEPELGKSFKPLDHFRWEPASESDPAREFPRDVQRQRRQRLRLPAC